VEDLGDKLHIPGMTGINVPYEDVYIAKQAIGRIQFKNGLIENEIFS
jgi:hypothetical protein